MEKPKGGFDGQKFGEVMISKPWILSKTMDTGTLPLNIPIINLLYKFEVVLYFILSP